METVAERIIKVVDSLGMSKSEFARKINVTPAYISKLGKFTDSVPSDRTILDICREFDVNEEWLRTGEGDMFVQKTKDEALSAFFGDLLSGQPDFKRRLIAVLSRLDEAEWGLLEKMADRLLEEMQNEKADL